MRLHSRSNFPRSNFLKIIKCTSKSHQIQIFSLKGNYPQSTILKSKHYFKKKKYVLLTLTIAVLRWKLEILLLQFFRFQTLLFFHFSPVRLLNNGGWKMKKEKNLDGRYDGEPLRAVGTSLFSFILSFPSLSFLSINGYKNYFNFYLFNVLFRGLLMQYFF